MEHDDDDDDADDDPTTKEAAWPTTVLVRLLSHDKTLEAGRAGDGSEAQTQIQRRSVVERVFRILEAWYVCH